MPTPELQQVVNKFQQDGKFEPRYFKRLFRQLESAKLLVILLLDEFELIARNTSFSPDFFYNLRALAIHQPLALVTTSYRSLNTLSYAEIRSSPFFNIFATVQLGPFEEADVRTFFDHYLEGTDVQFKERERNFISSLAGHHPFYLQIASHFLFDQYPQKLAWPEHQKIVKQKFMAEAAKYFDYSWIHLDSDSNNEGEKISLMILAMLTTNQPDTIAFSQKQLSSYYPNAPYHLDRLAQRGYVLQKDEYYRLFSVAFAEWLRDELRQEQLGDVFSDWLKQSAGQKIQLKDSQLAEPIKRLTKEKYRGFAYDIGVNLISGQIADVVKWLALGSG
jgi:hypothetical protein